MPQNQPACAGVVLCIYFYPSQDILQSFRDSSHGVALRIALIQNRDCIIIQLTELRWHLSSYPIFGIFDLVYNTDGAHRKTLHKLLQPSSSEMQDIEISQIPAHKVLVQFRFLHALRVDSVSNLIRYAMRSLLEKLNKTVECFLNLQQ